MKLNKSYFYLPCASIASNYSVVQLMHKRQIKNKRGSKGNLERGMEKTKERRNTVKKKKNGKSRQTDRENETKKERELKKQTNKQQTVTGSQDR